MPEWNVARLLTVSADYLAGKGLSSPRLDAELLLGASLGMERVDLYVDHDRPVTERELDRFRELVARRARGEPVAYILGRGYFRCLQLEMTPAALIPRPETEELAGAALDLLKERPLYRPALDPPDGIRGSEQEPGSRPPGCLPPPLIADVGTGSGAIAFSLAKEAGVRVLATDTSPAAVELAVRNRRALGLQDMVEIREADLLQGVAPGSLRLVVSNPPYIPRAELAVLEPDVRLYEPLIALDGGPDGLDVYRRLIPQAARALGPGGAMLLEVGADQARRVQSLAIDAGFAHTEVLTDVAGKERIVRVFSPGALSLGMAELRSGALGQLGAALRAGAVVGLPTDTVYGIAAAWLSAVGVRRLLRAKGRDEEKPLQVLFASVEEVEKALPDLGVSARRVLRALLPGPFTFVVSTRMARPPLVGTSDSLGIRVPGHPALLEVLAGVGVPLAASSANRSGAADVRRLVEVDPLVLAACTAALDLPEPPASLGAGGQPAASTVVDLRPLERSEAPLVLREGAVPAAETLVLIARELGT